MDRARIAILGASGYTGAELVRLIARHPGLKIVALTAERQAGKVMADIFPHFTGLALPRLAKIGDIDFSGLDGVFCCLPHGLTQDCVAGLPKPLRIVDLSADFRLKDPALYAAYYGQAHRAPQLLAEAVYGLSEIARSEIAKARLVANPGCYPTAAQLPLIPLLEAGLIDPDEIVIDAKSGVSGAGREEKLGSLYAEVTEGIHAYGIANHRHLPEIEQGLSQAAGRAVAISFTPHLMPMSRGILATCYVKLTPGAGLADLRRALAARYGDTRFIRLLPEGQSPQTRHVRASNFVFLNAFADRRPGRAILIAAEDNLVKGASGQALQNFNLMLGFDEALGLEQGPIFP